MTYCKITQDANGCILSTSLAGKVMPKVEFPQNYNTRVKSQVLTNSFVQKHYNHKITQDANGYKLLKTLSHKPNGTVPEQNLKFLQTALYRSIKLKSIDPP